MKKFESKYEFINELDGRVAVFCVAGKKPKVSYMRKSNKTASEILRSVKGAVLLTSYLTSERLEVMHMFSLFEQPVPDKFYSIDTSSGEFIFPS